MLEIATQLPDKNFFIRLNTIPNDADAVANDVLYHLRKHNTMQYLKRGKQSTADFDQIVCDIEIINVIRKSLLDPSGIVIDMNTINNIYIELMQ